MERIRRLGSIGVSVGVALVAIGCTSEPHTTPAKATPDPVTFVTTDVPQPASPVQTVAPPPSTTNPPAVNDGDPVYTVRRYLSRWTGHPLQPDDTEGRYPLVCPASTLANNPGRLTGTLSFAADNMTSNQGASGEVEVSVPVTNSSSVTTTLTFDVRKGPQGYCIADITG
ncbi:hypothetical protein ACIP5Y_26000 [Nocardia sp. NPDC088792]|uniref:hypothetical protein n=1 Tax=Nocardia sp. NPDC088792 TaxID=3364332 RepID=UPI0037F38923